MARGEPGPCGEKGLMSAAAQAIDPFGVLPDPLPVVRETVRTLLLSMPSYRELPKPKRQALANSMVRVCNAAAELIREEVESDRQVARRRPPGLAMAQNAGSQFSGVAAQRVAGTTQAILNAV